MKSDRFEKLAEARFEKCLEVLNRKSEEYMRNDDKLHNFKRAGQLLGVIPEEALLGMATKHIVSIIDMVRDVSEGRKVTQDLVDEKIGDVINYMVLLEGLLTERSERYIRTS